MFMTRCRDCIYFHVIIADGRRTFHCKLADMVDLIHGVNARAYWVTNPRSPNDCMYWWRDAESKRRKLFGDENKAD